MSDSRPIDPAIVDWWLALSGRPPGAEKNDLALPLSSQADVGEQAAGSGRITYDGAYSWKSIKAFTIKMGLWLVSINLGLSVTLKLAADFFAKGAGVSVSAGAGIAAERSAVKSVVFKEALTLESLWAAAGETKLHLSKVDGGVSRVSAFLEDMNAEVEAAEAKADKMELLVNEMKSAIAAQRVDLSKAQAIGQRSGARVNRSRVAGSSASLEGSDRSISASVVDSSGLRSDVSGSKSAADGVNSESSSVATKIALHIELG